LVFKNKEYGIFLYHGDFYLDIYPVGLQYVTGDIKIASLPFFYEIRTILYKFLYDLDLKFNCAFFELEGADILNDNDIVNTLNEFGIGDIAKGDSNAASLIGGNPLDYDSKRLYDGLIVSDTVYNDINDKSFFIEFKEGYMWLPVKL
jgi:hypothetical protein